MIILLLAAVLSCQESPKDATQCPTLPPVYPDYTNVTIPWNIAPLNFLVPGAEATEVTARYKDTEMVERSQGDGVKFGLSRWKDLLQKARGGRIEVQVVAKISGKWRRYKPFSWDVAKEGIDPYLSYRLIEPDYEVYGNLSIEERCLEDFSTRKLSDFSKVGHRCMNCHTSASNRGDLTAMYVRGKGGGLVLSHNGKVEVIDLRGGGEGSVYFSFSPSGRYIAYSTNKIIPAFHLKADRRLEVFDTKSNVWAVDLRDMREISSPLLSDSTKLETFPQFSPDGRFVYYCTADMFDSLKQIKTTRYSLCRIGFSMKTGGFTSQVDTLVNARLTGKSVCLPRLSPDGRFLVYTMADYGTFPIWHPETDLWILDLRTRESRPLTLANSKKSDTYHSWSGNSRWLAFASKRDDGLFGKPYFAYITKNGEAKKPFCLPQEDPHFWDNCLKSFNIPELYREKANFTVDQVARLLPKD